MRVCLCVLALAAISLHAATPPKSETVRGQLVVGSGEAPVVETAEHQRIALDGDAPTRKVLHDPRVNGFEVSARGHFTAPGKFLIDPQYTRALVCTHAESAARSGGQGVRVSRPRSLHGPRKIPDRPAVHAGAGMHPRGKCCTIRGST